MKRTFPSSHFHSRSVKFDSGLVFGRKERGGRGENRGGSVEAERKASGAGWGIGRGRRGGGGGRTFSNPDFTSCLLLFLPLPSLWRVLFILSLSSFRLRGRKGGGRRESPRPPTPPCTRRPRPVLKVNLPPPKHQRDGRTGDVPHLIAPERRQRRRRGGGGIMRRRARMGEGGSSS